MKTMNILNIIFMLLLIKLTVLSCGNVKYKVQIPSEYLLDNEPWHPHVNRPYLTNDIQITKSSTSPISQYMTSLIQIKNNNHFLKQNNKKLQCGCRFVKEQKEEEIINRQNELTNTQNTINKSQQDPQEKVINNIEQRIQQEPINNVIETLKNRLEENTRMINNIENLLQGNNNNQQVVHQYQNMNIPRFVQVMPPQVPMPVYNPYPMINNGYQLPVLIQ